VKRALAVVALCLFIGSATNAADTKHIPQNWQEMFFPGSQNLPNAQEASYMHSGIVEI
jgi:hypothetical protein